MRDRVTIYYIVRKKFATVTKSGNIYYLNCIKQIITTNVVTTLKNEDTNEAIWHGRYHLGIKNSERPAKEHLVEELDCNVSKNAIFCESCVGGKQHQKPKTEGELSMSCLELHTVVYVERLKRSHSVEQDTSSLSLVTDHD